MNPLVWLVSGISFSLIGTMGVMLLRKVVRQPMVMRFAIWAVIWTSLLLPFAFSPFGDAQAGIPRHPAENVGEFCHCENPNAGDHLRFQANSLYDFLLQHNLGVAFTSVVIGLILFTPFAVRSLRTMRRLRRAGGSVQHQNGLSYRVVNDIGQLPVGAVGLFRRYIHWRSEMDALPLTYRKAIELHEEAHLRQLHTWERVAIALLGILWWMNPAWHVLRRELQLQAEFAADEAAARALGDRKTYATLLLHLASHKAHPLMTSFSHPSETGKRIKHLLGKGNQPSRLRLVIALVAVTIVSTGDALAGLAIQRSWERVEVYEVMNRTHRETGETAFCKTCAFENAAAECSE